ncbi:MAG: MOSC domain-containing protein [Planctomycetota bacterium]|jgi:MOSC domain-containing protein YiiM
MHEVVGLWVRPVKSGEMVARDSLAIEIGGGVVGDHAFGKERHVTLVFVEDWSAATRDLGRSVSPTARRANVLVTGGGGVRLIGSTIRLGEIELDVKGITKPCARMDEASRGLKTALEPDGRAGIWGRVTVGGTIRVGDRLTGGGEP